MLADHYFSISLLVAPSNDISKDFLENLRIRTNNTIDNID